MDHDTLALELIDEWKSGNYNSEVQKNAALQCLLVSVLDKQKEATKRECADRIQGCENVGSTDTFPRVRLYEAIGACLRKDTL